MLIGLQATRHNYGSFVNRERDDYPVMKSTYQMKQHSQSSHSAHCYREGMLNPISAVAEGGVGVEFPMAVKLSECIRISARSESRFNLY